MPVLYAHLERIDVNKGNVLTPKSRIGIIGTTGYSTGKHLHYGYVKKNDYVDSDGIYNFYRSRNRCADPTPLFSDPEIGKPSKNDITLKWYATTSPYSTEKPHLGVDFSGVIDKSYESKYAYNTNSQAKVLATGEDEFYGKYVILDAYYNVSEKPKTNQKPKYKNLTYYYLNGWKRDTSIPFKSNDSNLTIEPDTKKYGTVPCYELKKDSKGWKAGTRFK